MHVRWEGKKNTSSYKEYSYLATLLQQNLVILAQGDTEDDGRDVLEAVDPLLAFASLPSHIKHAGVACQSFAIMWWNQTSLLDAQLAHLESRLVDTGSLRSCSQYVHLCWDILLVCNSSGLIEEAKIKVSPG